MGLKDRIEKIINNNIELNNNIKYYNKLITDYLIENRENFENKEMFLKLMNYSKFKENLINSLDVNMLGRQVLDLYSTNDLIILDEKFDLLDRLNFKVDEDYIFELLKKLDIDKQNYLYKKGYISIEVVDRLYKYKYEQLKAWCKEGYICKKLEGASYSSRYLIEEESKKGNENVPKIVISSTLIPSTENEFANYWRNQSILLGEDALNFIMKIIRYYYSILTVYDKVPNVFSEITREEIINNKIEECYEKYYSDVEIAREVEKLIFNLNEFPDTFFDKHGLPLNPLFSNCDGRLPLLSSILFYNNDGKAKKYSFQTDSNVYRELDYTLILFFINNMDKIPIKYKFLFKKLKELNDIEDINIRKMAQREFLLIMTDENRIRRNPLFDEIGFNENFYNALLCTDTDDTKYLNFYDSEWGKYYSNNELIWIEKYKDNFPISLLFSIYRNEEDNYKKRNKNLTYSEINKIYPRKNAKELINYFFDELGPKPELCIDLYNKNEFDKIIIANLEYKDILNEKDSLILDNFKTIDDIELKKVYKKFILENKDIITLDKINDVADLLKKISSSNSMELINLRTQIANQLLLTDDPIGNFNLIEEKFVQNNLPTIGKIFSVFEILHPDFSCFNFSESSMVSPVLKKKSNKVKEFIVFADLIRITLGSNNRSLKEYLNYIKEGDKLYQILKNNSNYKINEEERNILVNYIKYIMTLYNNSKKGKINPYKLNNKNYIETLDELKQLLSIDGNLDYSLSDRVVSMFCHVAGFNTLEEVDAYMHDKIADADRRNRLKTTINLQPGDFVKGIGDIKYLGHILQNGSVAKEYLGQYATSDLTPLDTDLSMILKSGSTPRECMEGTEANEYGPIWFVVKNDNRLSFTRRSEIDPNQEVDERADLTKLETFYTGAVGKVHYGIRTGFASSDIDYIIVESYDKRIGLEIAMNGFYIPVFDKLGNRVFSPDDYDKIREKMQGLSYYDIDKYEVSKNLIIPGVEEMSKKIPDSISDVIRKRRVINSTIKKVLEKFNLDLKDHFDGDLSEGFVELIDTGSTGRFTNMPGDGDFDFMLKLDRKIKDDPEKMNKLKLALLEEFHCNENDMINSGDFRLKKVKLDNLDVPVDIDITFEVKTDKIAYSTDECLKDRLKNIRKTNPKEYYLIISNILLAKKYLKEFEVYKPDRGDNPQGGLGGVGIENWILQNGGSFYDAAKSFLEAARDKSFEEFQKSYVICDFGENHLVTRKNIYPHDNFVYNMSSKGYNKMKNALEKLFKNINKYGLENIDNYKMK